MTTAQCRDWLVSNSQIQQLVRDRCHGDDDIWIQWGQDKKRWKRQRKYNIGSATDKEWYNYGNNTFVEKMLGVDPIGGAVREFWLQGTDHVTVAILEKDGVLYFLEDLSD